MAETPKTTTSTKQTAANPQADETPAVRPAQKPGDNPTPIEPGDNLAPRATLADNPNNAPGGTGTGFHCGICGQPIGAEGQHTNANGDQVETPHAQTMVVADNWPQLQDDQDAKVLEDEANRRADKAETKVEENKTK